MHSYSSATLNEQIQKAGLKLKQDFEHAVFGASVVVVYTWKDRYEGLLQLSGCGVEWVNFRTKQACFISQTRSGAVTRRLAPITIDHDLQQVVPLKGRGVNQIPLPPGTYSKYKEWLAHLILKE